VLLVKPDVYNRQVRSTVDAVRNIGNTHYGVIWQRALVMARTNPVFGVGMNHYRNACENAAYGPVVQLRPQETSCALHPHNLYLEWLVEGGLIGGAGFVAAMLLMLQRLWRALPVLRTDYVFIALIVTAGLRLFPASTAMSMTRSWFSMPLWLVIGWALAVAMAATAAPVKRSP
jgi:O-antigen ligase